MIKVNGKVVPVRKFPNGELQVKYSDFDFDEHEEAFIDYHYDGDVLSDELMTIYFICGFIKEKSFVTPSARINFSYLPYERMDRETGGQVPTLKYFCKTLEDLGVEISAREIHNPKAVRNIDKQSSIILLLGNNRIELFGMDVMFPDQGAYDRYTKSKRAIETLIEDESINYYCGQKIRNPFDGKIEGYKICDEFGDQMHNFDKNKRDILIIDDLCEGGMTFQKCAEYLKDHGFKKDVYLLVYHLSSSALRGVLTQECSLIKKVYATNSMLNKKELELFKQHNENPTGSTFIIRDSSTFQTV